MPSPRTVAGPLWEGEHCCGECDCNCNCDSKRNKERIKNNSKGKGKNDPPFPHLFQGIMSVDTVAVPAVNQDGIFHPTATTREAVVSRSISTSSSHPPFPPPFPSPFPSSSTPAPPLLPPSPPPSSSCVSPNQAQSRHDLKIPSHRVRTNPYPSESPTSTIAEHWKFDPVMLSSGLLGVEINQRETGSSAESSMEPTTAPRMADPVAVGPAAEISAESVSVATTSSTIASQEASSTVTPDLSPTVAPTSNPLSSETSPAQSIAAPAFALASTFEPIVADREAAATATVTATEREARLQVPSLSLTYIPCSSPSVLDEEEHIRQTKRARRSSSLPQLEIGNAKPRPPLVHFGNSRIMEFWERSQRQASDSSSEDQDDEHQEGAGQETVDSTNEEARQVAQGGVEILEVMPFTSIPFASFEAAAGIVAAQEFAASADEDQEQDLSDDVETAAAAAGLTILNLDEDILGTINDGNQPDHFTQMYDSEGHAGIPASGNLEFQFNEATATAKQQEDDSDSNQEMDCKPSAVDMSADQHRHYASGNNSLAGDMLDSENLDRALAVRESFLEYTSEGLNVPPVASMPNEEADSMETELDFFPPMPPLGYSASFVDEEEDAKPKAKPSQVSPKTETDEDLAKTDESGEASLHAAAPEESKEAAAPAPGRTRITTPYVPPAEYTGEYRLGPSSRELVDAGCSRQQGALRSWYARMEELHMFRDHFGHTRVPQKYKFNRALGVWVNKQRMQYSHHLNKEKNSLTPTKIKHLFGVGFEFAKPKGKKAWDLKYKALQEYFKTHGHSDVPTKQTKDGGLGRWVSTQRQAYKNRSKPKDARGRSKPVLSDEQVALLLKVNFKWSLTAGSRGKRGRGKKNSKKNDKSNGDDSNDDGRDDDDTDSGGSKGSKRKRGSP